MTNLKKTKLTLAVFAVTLFSIPVFAYEADALVVVPADEVAGGAAKTSGNRGGLDMADMSSYMALSDEQKEQIRDIQDAAFEAPPSANGEKLSGAQKKLAKLAAQEAALEKVLTTEQWAAYQKRAEEKQQVPVVAVEEPEAEPEEKSGILSRIFGKR